uniref:(northern house mosquito) hypothetical protein n=1 Tax=Culex pipiens TaxID=7175 RepID=A0A8D8CQJ3_CULPI
MSLGNCRSAAGQLRTHLRSNVQADDGTVRQHDPGLHQHEPDLRERLGRRTVLRPEPGHVPVHLPAGTLGASREARNHGHGAQGPRLPGHDLRGRGRRDLQNLPRVLEQPCLGPVQRLVQHQPAALVLRQDSVQGALHHDLADGQTRGGAGRRERKRRSRARVHEGHQQY